MIDVISLSSLLNDDFKSDAERIFIIPGYYGDNSAYFAGMYPVIVITWHKGL